MVTPLIYQAWPQWVEWVIWDMELCPLEHGLLVLQCQAVWEVDMVLCQLWAQQLACCLDLFQELLQCPDGPQVYLCQQTAWAMLQLQDSTVTLLTYQAWLQWATWDLEWPKDLYQG
jgi:hypothetical protein